MNSFLFAGPGPAPWWTRLYRAGQHLVKAGEAGESPAYNLQGVLYLGADGYLMLSVPAPMVRGIFAAMHEPGIELPLSDAGKFEPACRVMSAAEVELIGEDSIIERGKSFRYSLGRLLKVDPDNIVGVNKMWVLRLYSPELQALRRSYGLSGLPADDAFDFSVPVAIVRRGVLGRGAAAKAH